MQRHCYISHILPGKSDIIRKHWENKRGQKPDLEAASLWKSINMHGFDCWLQHTPQGDFMIHCIEGGSLSDIFEGLRREIHAGNILCVKLNQYYIDVLGRDCSKKEAMPKIQLLSDIALEGHSQPSLLRKGYVYPILPHKVSEHIQFRKEVMGSEKKRHEASMKTFGVVRLTTWLQETPKGHFVVVYSERHSDRDSPSARLSQGKNSREWQEISAILLDHTGLSYEQLSPNIEHLSMRA